ncbi:AAEL012372-PB [Aedes aegypti]|uniref:AAEL012372-PA n=2 Tax=Aedes aegypti TaxID=7159 RepID=A6KW34_AEDAE|nr:uncharacterized protein LOC5576178 [Aedes aegypti]EAT35455.1 AAEL012372-PA [Aedes aegypti]EAT35456.1 AAEL012372-PB [Aedes aegypti]
MEASSSMIPMEDDSDCDRVDTTTKESDRKKSSIPSNNRTFRRHLDAAFQKHGSQLPDQIVGSHYITNCKQSEVEQYVNEFATKSEECVYQKLQDCEDFVRVTNWCEVMHSAGMRNSSNRELPLVLKTFAATERFPEPSQAKGVDFKLLYLNLSNMMLGHPVQEMNAATAKVLKDAYEDLLAETKRTDNRENTALIRPPSFLAPKPSSAENLTHDGPGAFFTDRNLNPLQIPFDKLFQMARN